MLVELEELSDLLLVPSIFCEHLYGACYAEDLVEVVCIGVVAYGEDVIDDASVRINEQLPYRGAVESFHVMVIDERLQFLGSLVFECVPLSFLFYVHRLIIVVVLESVHEVLQAVISVFNFLLRIGIHAQCGECPLCLA